MKKAKSSHNKVKKPSHHKNKKINKYIIDVKFIKGKISTLEYRIQNLLEKMGNTIDHCLNEYRARFARERDRKTKGKNANEFAIIGAAWCCLQSSKKDIQRKELQLATHRLFDAHIAYGAAVTIYKKFTYSGINERNLEYLRIRDELYANAAKNKLQKPSANAIALAIVRHFRLSRDKQRNIRRILSSK